MEPDQPPAAPATPDPWPAAVREVCENSITAEFASLTRMGAPVTVPTTPYMGAGDRTIDISTGLTYPAKAERARRNPRVCLLFADPLGSGLENPVTVLVQGLATVRDADLQANTDRYIRVSSLQLPAATKGQPRFVLRRMAWYFARIWIEITPLHLRWWPNRDLDEEPHVWHAPVGTAAPLSDPAPPGAQPRPWLDPPRGWRESAAAARDRLVLHDLTVIDANGFPLCLPVRRAELVEDGFLLQLGPGAPPFEEGPACLTMHSHPEVFTGQENRTFVGYVLAGAAPGVSTRLVVDRALADWSIAGNRAQSALGFLRKGRLLAPRLRAEAERRAQPVPQVRFPSQA